jgi:two-component system, NarL family, sensor histidine kinase UhpB
LNITSHLARVDKRGFSVRTYIIGLAAAILVPALLLGGWLTWRSANSDRALMERNSEIKAVQVVADIDHEIAAAKATLVALASSHHLQTGDFQRFHEQLVDVAKRVSAQFILRGAPGGHQIINSIVPWGQPLPPDSPSHSMSALKEAIATGTATISNVFFGPAAKKLIVSVGLPISSRNGQTYYLSVGIPVDTFAASLENATPQNLWVITLIDRDNTIIARSEAQRELAGSKLRTPDFSQGESQDGVVIGTNRFGITYRWVWRRSESTGWFVTVGVPLSVLEAPAHKALTIYAAVGGPLFILAMALAFLASGRISQSIGEMGIDRKPTREEFRALFESAPNGVLVIDEAGLVVLASQQIERQFGYTPEDLIGQPVNQLVPGIFNEANSSLGQNGGISREVSAGQRHGDLLGRRKDASQFPLEVSLNLIPTRNGNFTMATLVDVSARVLAEQRLVAAVSERDLFRRRIMQAQENERLRLAHELHDQTGQNLTAALLELKLLEMQSPEEGRRRLRALRDNLEQMGKTLHRIAWELRPASIDELGLTSALSNYVAEWSRQYSIEVDFHCRDAGLDAIAGEKQTAVYRIMQEALTNVAKHAPTATSVSVLIDRINSILRVTIEDDGPGFTAGPMSKTDGGRQEGGLGLAGMRERLTLIGGGLEVESSAGAGTTIFARIPLDDERLIA